jgi:hypothetical protein
MDLQNVNSDTCHACHIVTCAKQKKNAKTVEFSNEQIFLRLLLCDTE